MQRNLDSFFSSLTLISALFALPRATLSGKAPLQQIHSLEASSSPVASRSIIRRTTRDYDIICANVDAPTSGYPKNTKWSASNFESMWDLCSAFGNRQGNVGCLCENPGVSYDVDCHEIAANEDLYHQGGMFYLCQLRCVCKQHVKGLPLPEYLPLNRQGRSRRVMVWQDAQGTHTNLLALMTLPTASAIPMDCASLPAEKRGGCTSSEKTHDVLAVDSSTEESIWSVSRNRKAQRYKSCSAIPCSSFAECGSRVISIKSESIGKAPCRCQLDLNNGPAEGYFNLGSCSSFLENLGKGKREMQELQLESQACACNASFVSAACCATEGGMVWNQASLGQVLVH